MSNVSLFLKKNKIEKPNVFYPATKTLTDESGNPLEWEIRRIPTKEDEKIRESCTMEIPVTGKPGMFRSKVNAGEYMTKIMAAAVVFPDLYNAELQDSYGVKTPDELLKEMIDDPGEYSDFVLFVQKLNGYDITISEMADDAKN